MQLYTGDKIDNYEIVEYLASGGYGSVYKAKDLESGRLVALKMLNPGVNQPQQKARFVREIETLSRLRHPNIVKVFQWEAEKEPLWYTMELLTGPSLQKLMTEDKPLYEKVGILRQVAAAISYLHDQGYIHRDIKPQNLMFRTPESSTVVLFDMGLVHDPCSNLTLGRQILGTPGYLSPEQMDGRYEYKQIDVWAVGVILYQWLTKIHPFVGTGKSTIEVMHSIQSKEIIAPAKLAPLVDPYLAEICSKALEKDPEKRYPDGRSLESALAKWENVNSTQCIEKAREQAKQGHLDDSIIWLEKAYLWQQDDEAVKELKRLWEKKLGQADLRLVSDNKLEESLQKAQEKGEGMIVCERRTVADPMISPNSHSYVVCIKNTRRVSAAIRKKAAALEATDRKPAPTEPSETKIVPQVKVVAKPSHVRRWALYALLLTIGGGVGLGYKERADLLVWSKESWEITRAWIDSLASDKKPQPPKNGTTNQTQTNQTTHPQHPEVKKPGEPIWAGPLKCLQQFVGHNGGVHSVAIHPGGQLIASGSRDQTVRLWSVATGKELRFLAEHTGPVWSVAFSPDGKLLASGSGDTSIKLWVVESGKLLNTLSGHSDIVFSLAFTKESKLLISGNADRTIKVWDVDTNTERRSLTGHAKWILAIALSQDNKILASGSTDATARLWNLETGKELYVLAGHTKDIYAVAFSSDGTKIATGSDDKSIRLWDVASGKEIGNWTGHEQAVFALAFSTDGRFLASGSADNTIKIWDWATGKLVQVLAGHTNWVLSLKFSPDGQSLVSGSEDKTVRVWGKQ